MPLPGVAAVLDGEVRQLHAQLLKTKEYPSASANTADTTRMLAVDSGRTPLDVPGEGMYIFHLNFILVSATPRHRKLPYSPTSTCGTQISIMSSIFPLLADCLALTAVASSAGYDKAYVSDHGFVGYGDTTAISVTDTDVTVRCHICTVNTGDNNSSYCQREGGEDRTKTLSTFGLKSKVFSEESLTTPVHRSLI